MDIKKKNQCHENNNTLTKIKTKTEMNRENKHKHNSASKWQPRISERKIRVKKINGK